MASSKWALIRAAFDDVLDQPEPKRSAYLESAYSGRPEIVRAVQELMGCLSGKTHALSSPQAVSQARVFLPEQLVAGRFRIVRFLGAGGMGQVYEAYDQRIAVSIALKTLHPALANDVDVRERFCREIRVARQVSHPNLCRIFDLVEHHQDGNDLACLTMELLSGETLAGYVARARPLQAREALALLRPIADVLKTLHEHGIVHRDLKPSNVLLTPGRGTARRVVVTDFGLAKPVEGGAAVFESGAETRAGSPYFMAPELWNGVQPSIASDIYAFGLMADEMVTRSTAFDTASLPAFYYSKFREGPSTPAQRSESLPPGWENAILRCLHPDPGARPQSAMEFLAELESALQEPAAETITARATPRPSPGVALPVRTIAVLPFVDLSPAGDQAYFCDGLTEELIHLLSQIASLRVVSRASVFEARRRGIPPEEATAELKATHLLLGSVRRTEDRLRVTVQLVDTAAGCNLWSQRFDRKMTDAIAIQEEIAAASLEALKTELQLSSRQPFQLPHTSSMEAYNSYLEGLFEFNRQTLSAIRRAIACFERAATADSLFSPAFSGLGECYCAMEWYGLRAPGEAMPKARQYAEHALLLNGSLANAYGTLAAVKARYEWDWKGAREAFQRSLELNPGLSRAYFAYALDCLTPLGQLDEALRTVRYGLQLDPLSPLLHAAIGGCLYRMREYAAALKSLRHTMERNPEFYHAHWSAARVLEQLGRYEEAISEYQAAIRGNPDNPMILAEMGHCHGAMGRRDLAEDAIQRLNEGNPGQYRSPLCAALIHLGLSHHSEALECLSAAAAGRAGALIWMAVDPRLDPLRGESDFQSILSGMGLGA